MFSTPSLLRQEEHKAFSDITLSGKVLDLGGEKKSDYTKFFKGSFEVITANINESISPDIVCNLEKPLPIKDSTFDHIILINVLEHIFEYRNLISESFRVLKPSGKIVIVVPFIFPEHPSPEDYHRFTASALYKEIEIVGFTDISIKPLGTGVFSACYVLLDRLFPKTIRFISYYTLRHIIFLLDLTVFKLANVLGKKYKQADYALGFCVTARK